MTKMKFYVFTVLLLAGANLHAQSEMLPDLREDGVIEIPTADLKQMYTVDISTLNLDSFEEAVNFLSKKNTDLILFRPNSDGTEATVFLQLSKKPQWTVAEWNSAISEISFLKQ